MYFFKFCSFSYKINKMEIHTLQVQLDQAMQDLEAAKIQERASYTQHRLQKTTTASRRAAVRLLQRDLREAQLVKNNY